MGQRFAHDHQQRHGDQRLDEGHAYLIAAAVEGGQEHGVEHRVQQKARREQRQIGIHAHQIVLARLQTHCQQRAGPQYRQRQQFHQRHQHAACLYRVPLGNRQNGGIVDILLFPDVQEREEQPQHHIEKDDGIGVVGDQHHDAEQAEHRRHGVAHQPQLLI